MPDVIPCPQFGVPAEVIQRFWLDPTDGPIQHFQTICLSKHWLMPRAETVHQQGPALDHHVAALPSCSAPAESAVGASTAGDREGRGRTGVPALWVLDRPTGAGRQAQPNLATTVPHPDLAPPEYGAAATGGAFGIGAPGRDYRMTTGRWDRGRAIGGNILTKLCVIR
jgi:hypothetical protein